MNTLIIGGSRGIGWELAKLYASGSDTVTVTGRKQPGEALEAIAFKLLNLSEQSYIEDISNCNVYTA